jgi:hypothetical protein
MFVISAALSRFSIFCIFSLFVCFNSVLVEGKDIVRMNTGNQSNDLRVLYKMKVLETALDRTTEEFGLYEIKINGQA